MGKRGQITVFIIIGLIIIISAGLIIYMIQSKEQINVEEALVPEDAKPIYEYVKSCMNTLGQEALNIMANQGGYVQLPNTISRMRASFLPLDSNALLKVPYWSYNNELRIPSIPFMQNEVKLHVEQGLAFCVQSFAAFPQYKIVQEAPPQASVLFTENDVTVRLAWPLQADLIGKERSVALKDFTTNIPVRIKKVYELAKRIMYAENEQQFLEKLTLDAMILSKELPFDGLVFSCRPEKWRLDVLEEKNKKLMSEVLNQVRVKDTQYTPFLQDESVYEELRDEYERIQESLEGSESYEDLQSIEWPDRDDLPDDRFAYFHGFFDVGTPENDLKVKFHYSPYWDMNFNGHPNTNGFLQSNVASQFPIWLRFLCMNQYHFTYDVIYPVLVTVRDDESYRGEGYNFKFAFTVLVHHNEPSRGVYSEQQFTDYSVGEEFCQERGDIFFDFKAIGYDAYGYQSELTNVNVSSTCFSNHCELGTIVARQGANVLTTNIPSSCGNPFITFTKEGYLPATAQLTERALTVEMLKLRKLNIAIKKLPYVYSSEEDQAFYPQEDLRVQDEISLYLHPKGVEYDIIYDWPNEENATLIELIDDTAQYEADLMHTQMGTIVGGYHDENLTISYSDIGGAQTITFYVLESRPINLEDENYQMRLFDQIYSGRLNTALQPSFT
ncbi:hypothetical protein J4410_03685 [Candidatus Woesearchaeota archaeon]|nr:hypothetical protein [Candidatus Woesearchaeota archaeon]